MISEESFIKNLTEVTQRLRQACVTCGRDFSEVKILPVTKTHGAWAAEYAVRAGWGAVGENRVQEGAEKKPACKEPAIWTLIGNLQSNKAKLAVETFDVIQSVDRIKIVNALAKHAQELNRQLDILLQVNAGNDPAKHGAEPEDATQLLDTALEAAPFLNVKGLMTIAPLSDDPDIARRTFAALREIRDRLEASHGHPLPELSMGMSGDLESAVAEGSTCIRIGTALFGSR